MKNNKAMTLASLIIYVIALLVITTTMATLTKYFYNNLDTITIEDNAAKDYALLNNYLSKDINSKKFENAMVSSSGDQITIKLTEFISHRYKFEDNSIFYMEIDNNNVSKKVTICKNVTSCNFTISDKVVTLNILFNNKKTYNTSYTIK